MKDQKLNKEDLFNLVNRDVVELINAEKTYGNSWKQRGGVDGLLDDIRDLRCYLLLVDNFINKP